MALSRKSSDEPIESSLAAPAQPPGERAIRPLGMRDPGARRFGQLL
jgi:hypothetical protein